ncbi:MAG: alkaline phosphatase [Myxococcales bacterium]|nr:alkaline phosphatase [Myxococcales bacterium]
MVRTLLAAAVFALAALAAGPARAADSSPWFEAGREAVAHARRLEAARDSGARASNVILFVADGMGISTVTAARILEGQRRGGSGEENWLAFERLPHTALVKTYNTNQQTPDSAGTMTAIVTGVKTRAGVLSIDGSVARGDHSGVAGHRLTTILEQAEDRGLSTGIVTTTTLSHATPAACYAHSANRDWEDDSKLPEAARAAGVPDIARQLVEFPRGDGLEVALGGGRTHFLPAGTPDPEHPQRTGSRLDGRDLAADWVARRPNSTYVWNREQFEAVEATGRLLGLFEVSHMNFEIDRAADVAGEPSLAEMTAKAIEILSRNPKGYFLMVEGGRVDHGHHVGNAHRALTETIEFSRAVQAALDGTDPRETLVVVTADHSHVLTIGGYSTRGNDILGRVVRNDPRGEPQPEPSLDSRGRTYTTLGYQNGPGRVVSQVVWPDEITGWRRLWLGLKARVGWLQRGADSARVDTTDPDYLQQAAVPLFGETHAGEDVSVYAGGPGAWLFHGVHEQSYVYHAMVEALGWSDAASP